MRFFWGGHFEFLSRPFWFFFFASYHWKTQPIYMRYHFFLHYGWFFQNLGKEGRRTFMHATVCSGPHCIVSPFLKKLTKNIRPTYILQIYSRVHKSSDSFFSKILEKPSIVQKKMIPHIKGLDFSQRWSKKKFKMADLENSKWPPQKNLIFQLRQFSIFFHENFMGWSLG